MVNEAALRERMKNGIKLDGGEDMSDKKYIGMFSNRDESGRVTSICTVYEDASKQLYYSEQRF